MLQMAILRPEGYGRGPSAVLLNYSPRDIRSPLSTATACRPAPPLYGRGWGAPGASCSKLVLIRLQVDVLWREEQRSGRALRDVLGAQILILQMLVQIVQFQTLGDVRHRLVETIEEALGGLSEL